ncbi:MAG: protein kinase [Desulfobacterales bacterium]|nr:protein kinase [Desulfobacterales bacterium]
MADRIITDTSDFFTIGQGDILSINNKYYKITGHAKEMRFGLEDPKFWVKRAVDLDSGKKKIIKLSFLESFETYLGGVKIKCYRSPNKEAQILKLVLNNPYFMQGESFNDPQGNNIRIIDVVRGLNFLFYIDSFKLKYEIYFEKVLPNILKEIIRCFEGIRYLHVNGYRHGDIRNDHLIKDEETGNLVWIDFDYDFEAPENPFSLDIFGLGNILIYAIGKGFHTYYMMKNDVYTYKNIIDDLSLEDFALLDKRRFINLRKIYPIIPKSLNNVLLHFSQGTDVYYEFVDEIIEDLNRCLYEFH